MAENSGIAWTTHTHNEWEGCTKVGPGCDGCYAAARNDRFHAGVNWGPGAPRRLTSIQNRNRPYRWQRERRAAIDRGENPPPLRVFGGSLMDPFDNEVPQEWREGLWAKVAACPDLDWIFVTKRIGNVEKMAPAGGFPKNVIIIATIVNRDEAERDRKKLLNVKRRLIARHIGVSYEPAIGGVDWWPYLQPPEEDWPPLDWLIVGGESDQGRHKARPFDVRWASNAIAQARASGCAVFIKQMGSDPVWDDDTFPNLRDKAGADPEEWPADLRVREFPLIGGSNV